MALILVVEDNPANMKLATFLLESAGHVVLPATDAEAGLSLARTKHPSLILMDIQLPGMDGLQATAMLKKDAEERAVKLHRKPELDEVARLRIKTITRFAFVLPILFGAGFWLIWG